MNSRTQCAEKDDDDKEEEQPYGHEIKLKLKFHIQFTLDIAFVKETEKRTKNCGLQNFHTFTKFRALLLPHTHTK